MAVMYFLFLPLEYRLQSTPSSICGLISWPLLCAYCISRGEIPDLTWLALFCGRVSLRALLGMGGLKNCFFVLCYTKKRRGCALLYYKQEEDSESNEPHGQPGLLGDQRTEPHGQPGLLGDQRRVRGVGRAHRSSHQPGETAPRHGGIPLRWASFASCCRPSLHAHSPWGYPLFFLHTTPPFLIPWPLEDLNFYLRGAHVSFGRAGSMRPSARVIVFDPPLPHVNM